MQRCRNEVDGTAVNSSLLQSPGEQQRGTKGSQTLLFVMLSVVLCGIATETYFISCLMHSAPAVSELISNKTSVPVTGRDGLSHVLHSKPMAHLCDVSGVVHESQVMLWSLRHSLLHGMDYRDGRLEVQKEGYYHVYSKVSFTVGDTFYHRVMRFDPETTLMMSGGTKFGTSYLGGTFYFHEGQTIYVNVSDTLKIVQNTYSENLFGAFMV